MVQTRAYRLALSIPAKRIACITKEDILDAYNALVLYNNPARQNITSLELRFTRTFPHFTHKIRRLLSRLTHVDTLILDFPSITPAQCTTLLSDLHFPNLYFLSAKSLPHKGVVNFLSHNPHIGILSLSPSSACNCTKRPALSIVEISGPTGCVAALVHGSPVSRITATYTALSHSHTDLFMSMTLSLGNITFLHLDFSPDSDVDILGAIAASAPFLQTLELNEKRLSGDRQLVYPWSDTVRWATGLRTLGFLSRLSLRTRASLVQRPGNQADERRVISNWSGERAQLPQQLNFIMIWYLWGESTSRRSCWSRRYKKWIRESSQISPNSPF